MKKTIRKIAVTLVAVCALAVSAVAADFTDCADTLNSLGLFSGTSEGYALDRAPTRAEASVMLVRLLGKETEATALTYSAPFTDVVEWQQPYVQYLYQNGLTSGTGETTFSPSSTCSAQMYSTFLLRALGYTESAGDFTYATAISKATALGVADYANCNEANFLRDHVVAMSYTALSRDVKGTQTKLLEQLVTEGAVSESAAKSVLEKFELFDSYSASVQSAAVVTKMDADMDMQITASYQGKTVLTMTMPMNMKMDINESDFNQSKLAMTGKVNVAMDSVLAGDEASNVSENFEYYYTDGYAYMNMAGEKVKIAMNLNEYNELVDSMGEMNQASVEPICMIRSITKSGETYTVTYSGDSFGGLMNTAMSMAGTEDMGGITLSNISVVSQVENGISKSIDMTMKMNMDMEGETLVMDATVKCIVNATGDSVTVTIPDVSDYVAA